MTKENLLSILLLAALAAVAPVGVSCNKENGGTEEQKEENPDPVPVVVEGPQPGTYTFTASPLKGGWKAGDKIYIHGSYGPAAKTVTLTESQISADGKTASVELDDVFEFVLKPDYLYAAYPGEAVIENDGIMSQSTGFSVFDELLCVAYLNDNDFAFVDASAGIRFKVSGYDVLRFAGNQRPGMRFKNYDALWASNDSNFTSHKDDGYPFYESRIDGDEVTIWLPGTFNIKDGFTIFFGKDGQWPVIYKTSDDIRMRAGEITDLGDITGALVAYDGPEPKMPEMGERTKFTLNDVEELSGLCMSKDSDFLWGVGDEGDLVKLSFDGKLISKVRIGGDTEAVTRNRETEDLIIGGEPNAVYVVKGPDYNKKETLFSIADAKGYGNAGQEGITYYKDGLIYAGMQTNAEIYCIELATGEILWKKGMRQIFSTITEIADLYYDPETDWLWIIDSEVKKIFALTGDTEQMLGAYSIKNTDNPESITVDHVHSCIWVGDDYGTPSFLYKYEFTGLDEAVVK